MILEDDRHEEIKITMPSFSVDVQFKDVPEPCERQSFFSAFLGPARSGKTSLAVGMLTTTTPRKIYSGVFNHVHLIVPVASFNSMKNSPFSTLSSDKIHHDFTTEVLQGIIDKCEINTKKSHNTLIIIDDFMSNLKDMSLRKQLERLIANRRHLRVSMFIISQTYAAIPLSTRKQLSSIYLFRQNNLKEIENIREELIPINKNDFKNMYNHVFPTGVVDSHAFMFINVSTGDIHNKFRKMTIEN